MVEAEPATSVRLVGWWRPCGGARVDFVRPALCGRTNLCDFSWTLHRGTAPEQRPGPGTGPPCEQQRAAKRGRNCRQVFRVPTRRSSRLSRAEIERPPSPATHAHCLACPRVLLRGKGGPGSHVASLDVSCARLFLTRRCFVMRRGRLRDEGAARWRCCEMRLSGPLHWTRSARMHHAEEMQAAQMRCDMPLPRLQLASHCSRFAV